MEAEHRLWMFSVSLVLIPGSLILWGVGAAHGIQWFGLIVAMCIIATTVSILPFHFPISILQPQESLAVQPCK